MIPEQACSTYPVVGLFKSSDVLPYTDTVDYEDGPYQLADTSRGLQYQTWRTRLVGDTVYITAANHVESVVMVMRCVTEVSLAFDQNGRYLLTYLKNGDMWVYWYDPIAYKFVHTLLEVDVISPRATLDDKRDLFVTMSEVILAYVKDGNLYYRGQNDRFGIPHLLQQDVGGRLMRIGMHTDFRLQFIFQAKPYTTYSCTLDLNCL